MFQLSCEGDGISRSNGRLRPAENMVFSILLLIVILAVGFVVIFILWSCVPNKATSRDDSINILHQPDVAGKM